MVRVTRKPPVVKIINFAVRENTDGTRSLKVCKSNMAAMKPSSVKTRMVTDSPATDSPIRNIGNMTLVHNPPRSKTQNNRFHPYKGSRKPSTKPAQLKVDEVDGGTEEPKPSVCPIHPQYEIGSKRIRTKRGLSTLYCCPHEECPVACFEDLEVFLDSIARTMYYPYRNPQHPLVCYCNNLLSLRTSHSEKNPGRLYFTCGKMGCNMFQWADEEPREWIQEHWDWYNSK